MAQKKLSKSASREGLRPQTPRKQSQRGLTSPTLAPPSSPNYEPPTPSLTTPLPASPAPKRISRSRGSSPQPNGQPRETREKARSYASEGVKNHDILDLPSWDYQVLGALVALGAAVRLFRIYQPTSVVFDEVHFGGFATKYIKGKFFMDVHPPLAKLLITLAGWLAGFKGDFDFKDIGKDYVEPGVPYVAMRLLPAILGILTIPTMFLTLKAFGSRTTTAALGAALLIFENGLVTQSRLILLDSPLVTFTAMTVLAWTCFTNVHEQGPKTAFTASWWGWLAFTGLCLGATASVKWVGLFTIAWIGSLTVLQLWVLLADTKTVTPRIWFNHFAARATCLIVIPVLFYMAMFAIHLLCLVNPGDGDGFMSSEFQSTLNNKGMQDVPVDVAMGSRVSIRHHNTQGGYLHSHNHMYPGGSKQQQITLYPHKDENNVWLLENQTQPLLPDGQQVNGSFAWDTLSNTSMIENGMTVKLWHLTTKKRLHSHDVRAPVTEADWQQEASAYGYDGFEGDANDLFRVEIVKHLSDGELAKKRLRTIQTKFKLVHVMTGCSLFSHKVKLPSWGFEQQEVTCAKQGTLPNSIWYVEGNEHPKLGADAEKVNYRKPGFLGKFWELQRVMWTTNAGLVDSHAWDSRPPSWPVLRRGINFWGKEQRHIYLLGNPIVWWTSSVAVALYCIFKGIAILRWQRGYKDYSGMNWKRFDYEIGTSILGWALHYFPFFLMSRQLFLHHYFPALYFAVIALCQTYDFVFFRVPSFGLKQRPAIGRALALVMLMGVLAAFGLYSPLVYGNPWTKGACERVKFFGTWDFDCNQFPNSLADYSTVSPVDGSLKTANPSSSPIVPPAAAPPAQQQYILDNQQAPAQAGGEMKQPNADKAPLSPAPQGTPALDVEEKFLSKEEKVEYRDQDGRLLNEEEVKALQGKVEFKTRYETRTRVVDEQGNEIRNELVGVREDEGVAPQRPDTEGSNPETKQWGLKEGEPQAQEKPTKGAGSEESKARPASDANAATNM